MPGLEKIICAMMILIAIVGMSNINRKIETLNDKFDRIIDYQGLNEVIAD